MNNFKRQLATDVANVFLNPVEFGEVHCLNGEEVACVCDFGMGGLDSASMAGLENSSLLGLDEQALTLYLADDLKPRPVPGQELELDGEKWRVIEDGGAVQVREGLLVLKLSRAFS